MRTSTLLSTTAAVLLLGGGLALAQGKSDMAPERAPPAQRSAPAEKVAPPMNAGERKAPETTGAGSQNGAPSGLEPGRGGNTETKGTTGAGAGGEMKSSPTDKGANKDMKKSDDMKRSDDKRSGAASGAKSDSDRAASDNKSKASDDKAATGASDPNNRSTTGQGAAAGAAKLSTEQRTKITTIFKEKKVAPAKLDISINVGTRVPPTVRFYPVPVEVVEIYPEWRGYDYIIVGGDILILEPDTHVIVAILAA